MRHTREVPDYQVIPSIEQLRQRAAVRAMEAQFGSDATLDALRKAAGELRTSIGGSPSLAPESRDAAAALIEQAASSHLTAQARGSLRSVINATGVILHTNLGRAPLPAPARDRLNAIAAGYTNLEYDLATGSRGSRTVHAESLLTTLTGAEAAVVVNNNAAATLLILTALASGREVLISRGELVEIGGGFRVPDVMRQSGAMLREVGTTNRTRISDYTASSSDRTALILRVHPSNFRIDGFTERPALDALVQAARAIDVPLVEDLGSGCVVAGLRDEPSVQAVGRGRSRSGLFQRRQAARRPSGRNHRRARRAGRSAARSIR